MKSNLGRSVIVGIFIVVLAYFRKNAFLILTKSLCFILVLLSCSAKVLHTSNVTESLSLTAFFPTWTGFQRI